jgi:hypothetical protein
MLTSSLKALVTIAVGASSLTLAQPMKRDATISCQEKGEKTWFYQGDPSYATEGTLVGWHGPQLSFDGRGGQLVPFQIQSSICNSTALGVSLVDHSGSKFDDPDPIKLFIVDQPGKCLALASNTKANSLIVAADCSDYDTVDAQATQFWLRAYKYNTIVPYGSHGQDWGLQKADNPDGWIYANPRNCFSGQTCQTDNGISLQQGSDQ